MMQDRPPEGAKALSNGIHAASLGVDTAFSTASPSSASRARKGTMIRERSILMHRSLKAVFRASMVGASKAVRAFRYGVATRN